MANRYSQYVQGVNYSPESFRDLSVVPIALRQRHDAALAAQDDMLLQLDNIQVRDEDKDYLNQKREEITGKVNELTNKINTIGAGDSNLLGEFRNMKRSYNKEVSLAGGLGQANNIKKTVDSARANYLDFGVKQGWSPETAQKNFDVEYSKYNNKNPSSMLGQDGFRFGEFNPTFAPKQVNPVDKLKEIQPLIGEISKEEAFQNYKPVQDPNTGLITYQSFGGSKLSRSNLERLASVEKFLNKELMNPDSELRQSLRYSRPGVKEEDVVQQFLGESDLLIDAMGVQANKVMTQLQAPELTKPTSTSGPKSTSDDPASLVSTPTGAEVFEGKSFTDIIDGASIKKYEALEKQGPLSEEDANKKMQAILQQNRLQDALKDPSTINSVNNYLKKNGSQPWDINKYKSEIADKQNKLSQLVNTPEYKQAFGNVPVKDIGGDALNTIYDNVYKTKHKWGDDSITDEINTLKSDLDEAYNTSIPLDDLKYSKMYTFGAGEAANKAKTEFNKSATNYGTNWITQIENAGGKFTLPGDTKLNGNNDEDALKELKEAVASGQSNFEFGSLIDMGITGSSQLVLNYTVGTGEKAKPGLISIDFDSKSPDSSVIDNWLIQMQKTLDTPGQAVIQSILDNKQLKGISVDNETFGKEGFSRGQSETIKKLSNTVNAGYINSKEYKNVNYNNFPDREYNMVLNNDGFYTLYMRDGKNKEASPLGVGAWLNKEFTKEYLSKKTSTANPLKATVSSDKKSFVSSMKDLSYLADNSLLQVGANSQSFQKAKQEYISEVDKNQNNLELQYQLAVEYYNSIKNMTISHKNKKRNL